MDQDKIDAGAKTLVDKKTLTSGINDLFLLVNEIEDCINHPIPQNPITDIAEASTKIDSAVRDLECLSDRLRLVRNTLRKV